MLPPGTVNRQAVLKQNRLQKQQKAKEVKEDRDLLRGLKSACIVEPEAKAKAMPKTAPKRGAVRKAKAAPKPSSSKTKASPKLKTKDMVCRNKSWTWFVQTNHRVFEQSIIFWEIEPIVK